MRGGKRQGAGRKPESKNVMTKKAREAAALTGELPHEFLLRISRSMGQVVGATGKGKSAKGGELVTMSVAIDCAKAAAPYYAPKLASIEHAGPNGGPIQTQDTTDPTTLEAARAVAFLLAEGRRLMKGNT